MTQSTTSISCPHCGAANPEGSQFCAACGKALPAAYPTSPRIITADSMPTTAAGHELLDKDLEKTTKSAATALMWVAILQTLLGPVALYMEKARMERESPGMTYEFRPIAWGIIYGIAAVFWVLFIWARKSPLPAAIVGLVLFITLHVVDAVVDPMTLARGWLVKIIVIVVLCKAISAGVKRKRLLEARAASSPPPMPQSGM